MWNEILPPIPQQQWRENLALVAAWLADFGGQAIAEPHHIEWQAPATIAPSTDASWTTNVVDWSVPSDEDGLADEPGRTDDTDRAGEAGDRVRPDAAGESGATDAASGPVATDAANEPGATDAAVTRYDGRAGSTDNTADDRDRAAGGRDHAGPTADDSPTKAPADTDDDDTDDDQDRAGTTDPGRGADREPADTTAGRAADASSSRTTPDGAAEIASPGNGTASPGQQRSDSGERDTAPTRA